VTPSPASIPRAVYNFADPAYDALYAQALRLAPGPERTAIYRRMQAIVADEVAWIVRYRRVRWTVRQPWTSGLVPADLLVAPWAYADVDHARRAQDLSPAPR
jgi:oligopeptide transport system substrate-binding protein